MIYLATPYTASTRRVRNARYKQACRKAAELMVSGEYVFSPIAHSHSVATYGDIDPVDAEFWLDQDFAVLERCDQLYVYMMDGWENSHGVKREIAFAEAAGIPVVYIGD